MFRSHESKAQPLFGSDHEPSSSSAASSEDDAWAPVAKPKPKRQSTSSRISTTKRISTSRRSSVSTERHCDTCTCFKHPRKESTTVSIYSLFTSVMCSILEENPGLCPGLSRSLPQKEQMSIRAPFISKVWKIVKPKLPYEAGSIPKTDRESVKSNLLKITQRTINEHIMNRNKQKNRS